MARTEGDPRTAEDNLIGSGEVSAWAFGGTLFAATTMVMIGIFQAIAGLVAIIDDEFYVVVRNYTFDLDTTAWGWIHLVLGVMALIAGFALFTAATWAGVITIVFAGLVAIDNFFFIPYYPLWSLLVIALAVWVIWSLTRPNVLK